MPYGGFYDLGVEPGRGFGALAQDEQVLLDIARSLPRVTDGDEGCCVFAGAADVEPRGIFGGVDFNREICGRARCGASAAACQESGEYRYEDCELFHRGQN